MSSTIIQSKKYFKLTDGKNEVYIFGKISEDTNVSPKTYDGFNFYSIYFEDKKSAKTQLLETTDSILGCSTIIKDKRSEPPTIQAKVAFERFSKSIDKAVEINVEKIEINSDNGKCNLTWGNKAIDQINDQFKNTKISISYGLPSSLTKFPTTEQELENYENLKNFYSKDEFTKQDVLNLIEQMPMMGQYINHTNEKLNPDETAFFINHSTSYGVGEVKHEKITDTDTIEYLISNQKDGYLQFSAFNFIERTMIDNFATPELIEKNPYILKEITQNKFDELKTRQDIFEAIVKSEKPEHIQFMSEELLSNKDNALIAVKKESYTLKYFCENLKNDDDVVNAAIKQNIRSIEFTSNRIKNDKTIALEIVRQNGWLLNAFGESIKDDNAIVLEAIKQNPKTIANSSPRIRELCKDKDPIKTLESVILHEQLQKEIKPKGLDFAKSLSAECKQAAMEQSNQVARARPTMKI